MESILVTPWSFLASDTDLWEARVSSSETRTLDFGQPGNTLDLVGHGKTIFEAVERLKTLVEQGDYPGEKSPRPRGTVTRFLEEVVEAASKHEQLPAA